KREFTSSEYSHDESHLQLAKNVGYILVNAKDIGEQGKVKLKNYQIPGSQQSGSNVLDGIANSDNFNDMANLPDIEAVDDDINYRGGLLGSMSITNDGGGKGVQGANSARSIYNSQLSNEGELTVPGLTDQKVKVTTDGNNNPKGAKYNTTDLRYGLAWNDSSDLPQVKIQRKHNAQYLIPVSISRKVTANWKQKNIYTINKRTVSGGSTEYKIDDRSKQQKFYVDYDSYKLYLGDVRLGDADSREVNCDLGTGIVKKNNGEVIGQNYIETNSVNTSDKYKYNYINTQNATLANLKPVNNQIVYTRVDNSYPHYDSELFDHGSNRNSITATRDHKRNFVGNTEEKDTSDSATLSDDKYVGSSDDYSIGIVHAPQDLFNVDREGVPSGTGGLISKNNAGVTSTQNKADGDHGINKYTDTPENNNGMSIGKPESYTNLAKAYNVDIVNGKAVGKADDQAKNKDDRVALVQQLLDNGGNAGAYY
ncbi:MAG: hypothetical protein ACRCZW_02815, partial [Lactobacillaceae bacterium]